MDQGIKKQLDQQQQMLTSIYRSTEKTRQYFLWTLIISIVLFVLPLIVMLFLLPSFIDNLTSGVAGF
ncbi:MAG: hypothetical protein UT42_C0014G0015 [Candidatus Falkowbacteria bacterium GW2011_GWA2_39_24]|uniref:Uncharacterized protein n=1 Tax=Candidatus Falkowbacteria bacterium GW2011_GWA2_39_24 TaxID=1618634 RepID=A0A0G0QX82_9BACT|nr:MAG: hypothetical protein UT42_C0014G0015 [Candidatus Falkowbacteria bacterium GW2011_GWA2_39_24]